MDMWKRPWSGIQPVMKYSVALITTYRYDIWYVIWMEDILTMKVFLLNHRAIRNPFNFSIHIRINHISKQDGRRWRKQDIINKPGLNHLIYSSKVELGKNRMFNLPHNRKEKCTFSFDREGQLQRKINSC